MTNKEFASIFRKYKNEARACLYPPSGGYAWQDRNRTVELMNELLTEIPSELYPKTEDEDCVTLRAGNWRLGLIRVDDKRSANLIYIKDDHTAWVIEGENGKFVDFDIGGS